MDEEEKKAAEEEGKKKEGPKAAEDEKKQDKKSEEIVLKVFMHCEGCARKVRRCLKGFQGVEDVITDCKTSKVVVRGEKADPVKVLERVQRKSHRQVELVSPTPPPPEEPQKAVVKAEKKKVEACVIVVVLGVYMHCDACAQEISKRIMRMGGVESAEADVNSSQVTVKGVIEPQALVDHVYKKTGKHASIVKVEKEKKDEEKPEEEKKGEEPPEKVEEEAAVVVVEDPKMEIRKSEMYHYHPQNYQQFYQPQMFSDENPNACFVM